MLVKIPVVIWFVVTVVVGSSVVMATVVVGVGDVWVVADTAAAKKMWNKENVTMKGCRLLIIWKKHDLKT